MVSTYNLWCFIVYVIYVPSSSDTYNWILYNYHCSNRNVEKVFDTYDKSFRDHALKVIAGGDAEHYEYWMQMSERRNLMDPDRGELDLATGDQFVDGARDEW